jgi:hypothetical protein
VTANFLPSRALCEVVWPIMVWPITGPKSYVCETGKSMKAAGLGYRTNLCDLEGRTSISVYGGLQAT